MFDRRLALFGAALAVASIPVAAAAPTPTAPAWTVDHSASTLGFASVYSGSPFTGTFGEWEADIYFDPEDLAASLAEVTIETGSATTGDSMHDEHLPGPAWFAVSTYPRASFRTDSISAASGGGYVAEGTLTIRDVARDVRLPFDLAIDGDTARMTGNLTLDRTQFGLGEGAYGGGDDVAPEVTVNIDLTAHRAQ